MEFKTILFGGESLQYWLAYCILFLFGVLFIYIIKTMRRNQKDVRFDWGYWIRDNWRKLVFIVMLMYLCIRGYADLYPYLKDIPIIKYDLSQAIGIIVLGTLNQTIVNWVVKKYGLEYKEDARTFVTRKDLRNDTTN